MIYKLKAITLMVLVGLMTACAVTGPANDGFENSLESLDIGTLQDGDLLGNLVNKAAKATNIDTTLPSKSAQPAGVTDAMPSRPVI